MIEGSNSPVCLVFGQRLVAYVANPVANSAASIDAVLVMNDIMDWPRNMILGDVYNADGSLKGVP